ncbi:YnfC family lipoprotein [Escherichia coli]
MIVLCTKGIAREKMVVLLLLAVGALSACDEKKRERAEVSEKFPLEMASFSNEFEFDWLRGRRSV